LLIMIVTDIVQSSRVLGNGRNAILADLFVNPEEKMKLSQPKVITFWIAVILAILGVLATLVTIPVLTGFAFWLVVIGFIVLLLGNMVKGM
jgi:hypothetical protein